jgi:hypothetical protein
MIPRDDEHASQCQVLTDHQSELDDFCAAEMLSEFCEKCGVDLVEIARHLFCVTNSEGVARFESAFRFRQVNLCDRFFVQSLTRRRRVACKESGIALIDRRDLEPSEFLDARWNDAFLMTWSKEGEKAVEELREQLHHVEARAHVA